MDNPKEKPNYAEEEVLSGDKVENVVETFHEEDLVGNMLNPKKKSKKRFSFRNEKTKKLLILLVVSTIIFWDIGGFSFIKSFFYESEETKKQLDVKSVYLVIEPDWTIDLNRALETVVFKLINMGEDTATIESLEVYNIKTEKYCDLNTKLPLSIEPKDKVDIIVSGCKISAIPPNEVITLNLDITGKTTVKSYIMSNPELSNPESIKTIKVMSLEEKREKMRKQVENLPNANSLVTFKSKGNIVVQ